MQVDINSLNNVKHVTSYILAVKFISSLVTSPKEGESEGKTRLQGEKAFCPVRYLLGNRLFSLLFKKKNLLRFCIN